MRPALPLVCLVLAACTTPSAKPASVRYVAIGDSYSKGERARADEAWPALAASRLDLELVANLGVTGATAREVLDEQVPRLDALRPDVISLQVGVNDLVRGHAEARFRGDLAELVAKLIARVGPSRVVLVTIPDLSVVPRASLFGDPLALSERVRRFDAILREEAERTGARLACVLERSKDAAKDPGLISRDGIHPSARGYAAWLDDVLPALRAAAAR